MFYGAINLASEKVAHLILVGVNVARLSRSTKLSSHKNALIR